MLRDDVQLISVDDHLVEPEHVFTTHIEAKYRDRSPRIACSDVSDDELRRIAEDNARELYRFPRP